MSTNDEYEKWSAYIKSFGPDVKEEYHPEGDGAADEQKFMRPGKAQPEVVFAAIEKNEYPIKIWARLSYGNKWSVNAGWSLVLSNADPKELHWMKVDLLLAYERAYYSKKA